MEQLLQAEPSPADGEGHISIWRNPSGWLLEKKLSRSFWIFFSVAFFFDLGFAVYFFLFNLYLLDLHFNERVMGLVGGALTLGSLTGTLPVGWLARKIGLRPLLIVCITATPLLCVARAIMPWESAEIGLAFLTGMAMCIWGVCFPPALARLTTEENRASAFSLIFSVSIGSGGLGALVCGYLPQWLKSAGFVMQPAEVKRMILIASCCIAIAGLIPLLRLRIPSQSIEPETQKAASSKPWKLNPFLWRFLPAMALWTASLAAFTPFASVYMVRVLDIRMSQIGTIYSIANLIQLIVGLLTPLVFRWLGLINGIVATQIAAAVAIGCLAGTHDRYLAVVLFLSFSAAQWMSSPGLYNLLMTRMPDAERSTASAMTLFCNALLQSCATATAGILFTQFGYPRVLAGIAMLALMAAIVFRSLVGSTDRRVPVQS